MRDRLALPFLLPLIAVGAILLTIFSFGQALLELEENGSAWPLAIIVAAVILLIASLIANQSRVRGWPVYAFTALPAAVILAVGMYYLVRPEGGEGSEALAVILPPGPIVENATDNRFSVGELAIVANQQYSLTLNNQGVALHNWQVRGVNGPDGREIQTRLLQGGQSETIQFTIAAEGEYEFFCQVHPVEMVGDLRVVSEAEAAAAAASGAGGGASGPGTITSVAIDNRFQPTEYIANANESTTLTLENRGTQIHNWHALNVPGGATLATALIPGGQSNTITFTISQPGTYDVVCDVHVAEMRGRLTVR